MATIDKHGALHDKAGKYAGSTRGGVTTEVAPRTAIEWKQALFSDFSPPKATSVKNPEATAAAKQAIFLAPHPIKSNEGNTVKLKSVLKGIGVGAAIIGVAAGCAGGNATDATKPTEAPAAPATATVETTPDTESTEAPVEATPASEAPTGPQPGEVGYVTSAEDVEAGKIIINENARKWETSEGQSVYMARDGSAIIIDSTKALPQVVLDDLAEYSRGLDNTSQKYVNSIRSLASPFLASGNGALVIQKFRVMDDQGHISIQTAPYAFGPDGTFDGVRACVRGGTEKQNRDGTSNPIVLDHDEAIALAQKCAKLKPGIPIYDVTGLVPPTQLQ
ncbi:MAG: hypothetical protein LBH13_09555 [Cellulomonadaceae bacterium]|jgi:hypothetical protein|nr:hypothetical protein [Cellulomonadaceae bacterium]